jgi:hypothetical protein
MEIKNSIRKEISERLNKKNYFSNNFTPEFKIPLEMLESLSREFEKQFFTQWLVENLNDNLTGFVLIYGAFNIKKNNHIYEINSEFKSSNMSIMVEAFIDEEQLSAKEKKSFNMFVNNKINLYLFGYAREYIEEEHYTLSRKIQIALPISIFE